MYKDYPQVYQRMYSVKFLRTIPGLENVEMMRTGYAIEYDAIVPTQLWPTLETKKY
ncbi:hypothetical protein GCM10020331_019860 [Ectobacillus funiculus]